jgi:energy-coupling factor transport system ATP-binding protein
MKITVSNLTHQYHNQVTALQNVDLTIHSNESVAIVGENGAGKTTLAKHLNGLLKPTHGDVLIGEHNTADHTPAALARYVGYAFQNPDQQIFASKVAEEVRFGPRNLGFSPDQINNFSQQALKAVGLENQQEKHPYDLHPADRKLLTLASVLAMQTPIIVFDEPTTGQDAYHIDQIGSIITDLQTSGRTVLTISHDLDFCARYFNRVIVLRMGKVIADGLATDVLKETELLASAAVTPPQLVRLSQSLGLKLMPRTPDEFVEGYSKNKPDQPNQLIENKKG